MFKVISLLAKRGDLSKAELIAYYEAQHAPLIRKLFPWIVDYRRNFIDLTGCIFGPKATPLDFDVVTEIWFADRAGYDRMLAEHAKPGVGDAIAKDESNFMDSSRTRFFIVDEKGT
ncbi:MAG: EthD domain-containing protein [Rhodospirillaceae bacterium]|nr:EthD domain-containing protein [Rhodospirillaceae bacterium]